MDGVEAKEEGGGGSVAEGFSGDGTYTILRGISWNCVVVVVVFIEQRAS